MTLYIRWPGLREVGWAKHIGWLQGTASKQLWVKAVLWVEILSDFINKFRICILYWQKDNSPKSVLTCRCLANSGMEWYIKLLYISCLTNTPHHISHSTSDGLTQGQLAGWVAVRNYYSGQCMTVHTVLSCGTLQQLCSSKHLHWAACQWTWSS